jgi:hypothetical protein
MPQITCRVCLKPYISANYDAICADCKKDRARLAESASKGAAVTLSSTRRAHEVKLEEARERMREALADYKALRAIVDADRDAIHTLHMHALDAAKKISGYYVERYTEAAEALIGDFAEEEKDRASGSEHDE